MLNWFKKDENSERKKELWHEFKKAKKANDMDKMVDIAVEIHALSKSKREKAKILNAVPANEKFFEKMMSDLEEINKELDKN